MIISGLHAEAAHLARMLGRPAYLTVDANGYHRRRIPDQYKRPAWRVDEVAYLRIDPDGSEVRIDGTQKQVQLVPA